MNNDPKKQNQESSLDHILNKNNEFQKEDVELQGALEHIWDIAQENHLDPFPTIFEVVPPKVMNQIGSYGIPNRYSHWTFGRTFRQMKTQYDYGLSKIYELVINSDPSQAFLLENNPTIENKFVMAHVLGHTDFFKNNFRFANTRRDMPSVAERHAEKIADYEEKYGRLNVEMILDATLSIEEHVDPFTPNRMSRDDELKYWRDNAYKARDSTENEKAQFSDMIESRKHKTVEQNLGQTALHIPPLPDKDLLGFIRNHAPYLEDWQRDVVDIVRSEAIYFYPQKRTKIMNEGWAAYWHKRIMREMGDRELITDDENESWWKLHSSVVAPNPRSLNPYYLGMKVYEYLEDYYNGNLDEDEISWLEERGETIYPHFEGDLKDSPAADKLREVMMHNDDQSFIRNYFDRNIAKRMDMYIYESTTDVYGLEHTRIKEAGWEEIREKLVSMLDNAGTPHIHVVDGDFNHSGQLYLKHTFDGRSLDKSYINKTLIYINRLWGRQVHLETPNDDGTLVRYTCNGSSVYETAID